MIKKIFLCILTAVINYSFVYAQISQPADSSTEGKKIIRSGNEMQYNIGNGKTLIYTKPRQFGFIRDLPKDAGGIVSTAFKKESIKPWLLIGGSTALLLLADQAIADGVIQFSQNIHLHSEEKNKNLLNFKLSGKEVSLFRLPANVNTGLYQIGQGFPSLLIGAGLYTYGKINKDYRALSTASQLAESFILMGVGTQIVKRITGRQDPSESKNSGWSLALFSVFFQIPKLYS